MKPKDQAQLKGQHKNDAMNRYNERGQEVTALEIYPGCFTFGDVMIFQTLYKNTLELCAV